MKLIKTQQGVIEGIDEQRIPVTKVGDETFVGDLTISRIYVATRYKDNKTEEFATLSRAVLFVNGVVL